MSNQNYLKITDLVRFSLIDQSLISVRDDFHNTPNLENAKNLKRDNLGSLLSLGQTNPLRQGLQVRIAATHAGIITRNNGFYLPDSMKKGATSFTDGYPKPVLLHHEDHKDPVGRIVAASYKDTSHGVGEHYNGMLVKNKYGEEVGTITDTLINDFVNNRMPFGMQVDIVSSMFTDSLLSDNTYRGLGHIELVANITDKNAVEKLLDGRYITGSIGASTDKAVCSICKSDWTKEGPCDHKPGAVYDSAKCFIIAGELVYDEYSFVNVPADKHSKVLELNYNGLQDQIEIANDYEGRLYEVKLSFPQYDSKDKEKQAVSEQLPVDIKDSATVDPQVEASTVEDTMVASDPTVEEASTEEVQVTDNLVEDLETAVSSEEVNEITDGSFEDLTAKILDGIKPTDENEQKLYDYVWEEVEQAIKNGELPEEVKDAKLSAEQRNKLAKSTFCGPLRSFPVTDGAHALAVIRLLDKYNEEATEKMLATAKRKAKALGFTLNVEDKLTVEDQKISRADVMSQLLQVFEQENFHVDDSVEVLIEDKSTLKQLVAKLSTVVGAEFLQDAFNENGLVSDSEGQLMQEIEKLEIVAGDLRDQLAAIRKEYNSLFQDMEALQDARIEDISSLRKVKENYLSTLVNLEEKEVKERDYTEFTDSSLDSELNRIVGSVSLEKITDKLTDGLSRIPTETVEDPIGVQETGQFNVSVEDLAKIEEHYMYLRLGKSEAAAESYLSQMRAEGKLPEKEHN
ncbi:MAG: hypothetical protein CMB80_03560 [Flammeovirgaceae bacterium]|nr:hypothetical protein [Flammeovirgaceae bacterium]